MQLAGRTRGSGAGADADLKAYPGQGLEDYKGFCLGLAVCLPPPPVLSRTPPSSMELSLMTSACPLSSTWAPVVPVPHVAVFSQAIPLHRSQIQGRILVLATHLLTSLPTLVPTTAQDICLFPSFPCLDSSYESCLPAPTC